MTLGEVVEPNIIGLTVSMMVYVEDGDYYQIDFTDGSSIEFHGGSVGYENASPYYERE